MIHGSFTDLKVLDKVEFFVQCQRLLMEHHPDSPFLCHQNNLQERIKHVKSFVTNYKGLCYQDDTVCALYNRIIVTDTKAPEHALRMNMYKTPSPDYNAVVIDFVVFRDIKDCARFVQANYDPRVLYVLFVRHNKVKLYPVVEFLQQIFNIPVV